MDEIDLDEYIPRLQSAALIPPICGVEIRDWEGRELIRVEVLGPVTDDVAARIRQVLYPVSYEIREVKLDEHGRRSGVRYR